MKELKVKVGTRYRQVSVLLLDAEAERTGDKGNGSHRRRCASAPRTAPALVPPNTGADRAEPVPQVQPARNEGSLDNDEPLFRLRTPDRSCDVFTRAGSILVRCRQRSPWAHDQGRCAGVRQAPVQARAVAQAARV